MNHRKWCKTTLEEVQSCLAQGMSLRQIADKLNCSPQGLRQACSLLEELNIENRRDRVDRTVPAHNPFGMARA